MFFHLFQQLVNLTRLRKLCLSDNEIRELPHNLGNLVNLAELDVSRNGKLIQITNMKFVHCIVCIPI